MEKLPVELHRMIYAIACLDDGSSGCALSAVSHYVRAASADYRYQCIALNDSYEISLFHDLVMSKLHDAHNSRPIVVRHLYIRVGTPQKLLRNHVLQEGRRNMTRAERKLPKLLRALQESLETLALLVPGIYSFAPDVLFGDDGTVPSFSRLSELTLCGRLVLPPTPTFALRLTMLHLFDNGPTDWLPKALRQHQFPNLSHLRMSNCASCAYQQEFLSSSIVVNVKTIAGAMGILPTNGAVHVANRDELCPLKPRDAHGRVIVIDAVDSAINSVSAQMQAEPDRFKRTRGSFILHYYRPYLLPYEADPSIKAEWLERLNGESGGWPPAT